MVHELEVFEFPEEPQPEDDATGRLAYKQKCAEFDFYMFPVDSVLQKFDAEVCACWWRAWVISLVGLQCTIT